MGKAVEPSRKRNSQVASATGCSLVEIQDSRKWRWFQRIAGLAHGCQILGTQE